MQLPEALSACGKVSEKVKVLELSKGKVSSCRSLLVNLAMLPNSRGSPLGVLYSRRRHGALTSVAQWIEQQPAKHKVPGLIPSH